MLKKIVLDLETQKDFSEVSAKNRNRQLRVSVAGIYSYQEDAYRSFEEKELVRLGELLQDADLVIGYNIKQFDYEVLQPYFSFKLAEIPTLDLLEEIGKALGHRIRLDAVAQATLGEGKSGAGKNATALWRNGRIDELKSYCPKDVELTRRLYDYATEHGKLMFKDFFSNREIPLKIVEPTERTNVARQRSLF